MVTYTLIQSLIVNVIKRIQCKTKQPKTHQFVSRETIKREKMYQKNNEITVKKAKYQEKNKKKKQKTLKIKEKTGF